MSDLFGPNPCGVCGGEYGEHDDKCRLKLDASRPSACSKELKLIENLWYRVRLLEMILIRQADNEETRNMLHGIRASLYETGEHCATQPVHNFLDVVNSIRTDSET